MVSDITSTKLLISVFVVVSVMLVIWLMFSNSFSCCLIENGHVIVRILPVTGKQKSKEFDSEGGLANSSAYWVSGGDVASVQ